MTEQSRIKQSASGEGWTPVPHVLIGGLATSTLSQQHLIDLMLKEAPAIRANGHKARLVFDSNGQGLSLRASDPDYKKAVDAGDIVHADGGVIVAASRLFGAAPIVDRSATTDFYQDSLVSAADKGTSYYLFGGPEDVNAACAQETERRAPGIKIVGRRNGYFSENEEEAIIADINAAAPDVLWVGLGKPKEQIFCFNNRDKLNVGWIVTCGGLFNFVIGTYKRAPVWMQKSGLEWVHRVATGPRYLIWRYLKTNPHALWLILTQSDRSHLVHK